MAVVIETSGQLIGSTTIMITDNDGECVCACMYVCIEGNLYSLVSVGVLVMVPGFMEEVEGNEIELCMNVTAPVLEREVNLTFKLIPTSTFAGTIYTIVLIFV